MLNKKSFFLSIVFCFDIICISHFLSACTLKPAYSIDASTPVPLRSIEIAPIPSVEGAELVYHLSNLLPASNQPKKYLLKVKLNYVATPIAIQKNSDILRQTLNQVVEYQLYDQNKSIVLTRGKFNHITSYASTFSPYTNYIESEEALKNLSKQAAEDIRTRLLLYFSKNSNL